MTPKEEKKEEECLGVKDAVGPIIDVDATLSANLHDVRAVLGDIGQYVEDGIQIHTMLRDVFLEKNNNMGVLKHQGSVDTLRDVKRILSGEKIATLAEMRAEMKKAEEGAQGDYMR